MAFDLDDEENEATRIANGASKEKEEQMNRKIKFRGKMLDSDDFVYGYYIHSELPNEIFEHKIYCADVNRLIDVKEETVGQYTGLHDKNGKEIYEEDVVKITNKNSKVIPIKPLIAQIVWSEEYLAYILITTSVKDAFENLGDYIDYDIEVIGNIYDNPELLGGE
nr:MAG TPA: YopX protein [Caudoviricetes sp.]